jgi:homoserine O-acetyltransferase/O-succinyltransferase
MPSQPAAARAPGRRWRRPRRKPTRWSTTAWRDQVASDANDFIYQWEASHDYNPSAALERIEATLLAINAADDERNPPETGITDAALKRVRKGRLYLIPASTETRGHLTTGSATFYKQQLQELLQTAPQRTM